MAVTLRRNTGTALTFDQLDDNFVDYTTFRDKFDQSEWTGSGDAKLLYFDNNTGKIKIKELTDDDLNIGAFNTNFNTRFAGKTTTDLSEGSNLYYTSARANADFDTRLATKSTTNLAEGTNLYYTDARVLTKINATSVTALSDMPATAQTDDAKVITYDYNTNSFRYSSLLTESLLPVTDHGLITDGNVVTGSTGVTTTSLQSLTNVNFASVAGAIDGNVLVYDQTAAEWKAGVVTSTGGVVNTGVTTFDALSDTPANFTGSADKFIKVKSGEDGLEFATLNTDDLTEGTSKFYTDSRFDTRLLAKSTDDLSEGSSNLYYTNTRADSRVALHVGANLNLGSKTTDDLAEGSGNLYYTEARANAAFDTKMGTTTLSNLNDITAPSGPADNGKLLMYFNNGVDPATYRLQSFSNTDALPEGSTNEYYTTAKVDARISATSINALSDVDTTTSAPSDGESLVWNASSSKWIPGSGAGAAGGDITAVNAGIGFASGSGGTTGSVALNIDVGTTANKIVQLDGSARLPAVDGSQLTNISYTPTIDQIKPFMIDTGTGVNQLGTHQIPEVTNLYYTDARARAVSIENVVEDTTPQLGGDLDTNNNKIQSASILNLKTTDTTNGALSFEVGSNSIFGAGKVAVSNYDNSNSVSSVEGIVTNTNSSSTTGAWIAGGFNFNETGVSGSIQGSGVVSSSGDIAFVGDMDFSSGVISGELIGNFYLDHPTGKSMVDGLITATVDGVTQQFAYTGADVPFYIQANSGNSNESSLVIGHPSDNRIHILDSAGNTVYKLPATDGTAGQVLTTNGNGDLYWN